MQGIHTYIPETNHVPREHRVAAILVLLFMVLISLVPALTPLYLYVSTFRSMCAVPNIDVLYYYYYYRYYFYNELLMQYRFRKMFRI
jgi:hypothetical protein